MNDVDDQQHSLAWFRSRLGMITGSAVGNIMKASRTKGEVFGDTALAYLRQLAAERMMNPAVVADDELFSQYIDSVDVSSRTMRFGSDMEQYARDLFVKTTGFTVRQVGSARHDTIPDFAASPDGLIYNGDDRVSAVLEIKCPKQSTFIQYAATVHDAPSLRQANPMYFWQTLAEMMCIDVPLCYFCVYCPWQSSPLHTARIRRDTEAEEQLTERVLLADEYIEQLISDIKQNGTTAA